MENLWLKSFCENLKREAFKEKLLGSHCIMSIDTWIESIKDNLLQCTTEHKEHPAYGEFYMMVFKMFSQIFDIMEEKRRIYAGYMLIGIYDVCHTIMQFKGDLEDGWTEKHTCDRVIDDLLQSCKYKLNRESSIPGLVNQLKEEACYHGIYDLSIVVDRKNWETQILTLERYRNYAYPDEGDDHLIEAFALSEAEKVARKEKRFNKQFFDLLHAARYDRLVGPLISIPKLVDVFNNAIESRVYTHTFTPWTTKIIDYACNLLIETFQMALMETDWSDVLVAKFMDPDEYEHVSFVKWHETMFTLLNPPALLHLLYKDVPEEEREEKHKMECQKFIDDENARYATYQIEHIEGEFAKLCDDNGKIVKLTKY